MKTILCDYAHLFIGMKYVWGGDDASSGGMDCSGLVLECLRSIGYWDLSDTNAQGIYNKLSKAHKAHFPQEIDQIEEGDLLFFGKSLKEIDHIAIYCGSGQMIEAGGGNATNHKGMVRKRLITWRKDLVGFLQLH